MLKKIGQFIPLFLLFASCLSMLAGGSLAMQSQSDEALNDKCIKCHVDIYNKSISSLYKHEPCFERQCIVCHLSPQSSWRTQTLNQSSGSTASTFTGVPVADQGDQWRKSIFFDSQGFKTDHVANLSGLSETQDFRFRIVVSNSPQPAAGQQVASPWLGLNPSELQKLASESELAFKISGAAADTILSPTIQSLGNGEIAVRWQSPDASYGWVEVQAMDGIDLQQMTSPSNTGSTTTQNTTTQAEAQHPLMQSPDYTTIDLCYTCHPENELGTSHPVRIYAKTNKTRIPTSLPTGKDGMLTCVTCHNPHGSGSKALVRELIVTKLCVACHYTFNRTSKATMF